MKKLRKKVLLSNDTVEAFVLPCPCSCSCRCYDPDLYSDIKGDDNSYERYESKMENIEP